MLRSYLLRGHAGGAAAAQEAGPGGSDLQPDEARPRPDPRQGRHEPRGHGQLHLLHRFQEKLSQVCFNNQESLPENCVP